MRPTGPPSRAFLLRRSQVRVLAGALERPDRHPAAAAVSRSGPGSPGDPNPSRSSIGSCVRAASRRPDGDTRTLGEGDTVTTLWPAVSVAPPSLCHPDDEV